MFYSILAETAAEGSKTNQWLPILLIGGFFIVMMVMTIIPQKKRQKQMQSMLDNLSVGDKIMTIGRMIGKVVYIDSENKQVVVNVGTEDTQTLITIDRNAVGYIVDSVNKPADTTSAEDTSKLSIDGDKTEAEKKDDDLKI